MAIKRITISVPEELARKVKKASGSRPVSEWVTGLIEERLSEAETESFIEKFYEDVAPLASEVKRGKATFARLIGAARRKKRAA